MSNFRPGFGRLFMAALPLSKSPIGTMEPHRSILINSPVCYEATYLVGNNADAPLGFAQPVGVGSRIVHVIVYALPGHKAYYGLATGNDLKSNSHVIAIPYPSLVGIVFDHFLHPVLMEMSGHFTTSCGKSRGTWRQRQLGQVVSPAYPMAGHSDHEVEASSACITNFRLWLLTDLDGHSELSPLTGGERTLGIQTSAMRR